MTADSDALAQPLSNPGVVDPASAACGSAGLCRALEAIYTGGIEGHA